MLRSHNNERSTVGHLALRKMWIYTQKLSYVTNFELVCPSISNCIVKKKVSGKGLYINMRSNPRTIFNNFFITVHAVFSVFLCQVFFQPSSLKSCRRWRHWLWLPGHIASIWCVPACISCPQLPVDEQR